MSNSNRLPSAVRSSGGNGGTTPYSSPRAARPPTGNGSRALGGGGSTGPPANGSRAQGGGGSTGPPANRFDGRGGVVATRGGRGGGGLWGREGVTGEEEKGADDAKDEGRASVHTDGSGLHSETDKDDGRSSVHTEGSGLHSETDRSDHDERVSVVALHDGRFNSFLTSSMGAAPPRWRQNAVLRLLGDVSMPVRKLMI